MFHYTTPYDCSYAIPQDRFNQFYTLLNLQREAELKRQRELQKPRIVKKVETEDLYQIQIFKEYGNFNSYEVQVVKKPRNRVHVLITSEEDQFQRIFEFNLNDIEVKNIDWEYFASEKVLVLNIPKKQQVAEPQVTFHENPFFNFLELFEQQRQESDKSNASGHQKAIEYKKRADRAKQRAIQKKADAAEKKRKEAELKRQEEEEKRIHLEAEERRRQEAKRQAAIEKERQEEDKRRADFLKAKKRAEEERRREDQERVRKAQEASKRAEEAARVKAAAAKAQAEAEAEKAQAERSQSSRSQGNPIQFTGNAEDFLQQLFGAIAQQSQNQRQEAKPDESEEAESLKATTSYESDAGSIFSDEDVETPTGSVVASPEPKAAKLTKQPSLEEVEDEEFVMFRKKFGQ